jgi:hypothetical protein
VENDVEWITNSSEDDQQIGGVEIAAVEPNAANGDQQRRSFFGSITEWFSGMFIGNRTTGTK